MEPGKREPSVVAGVKFMLMAVSVLWGVEVIDFLLPGNPLEQFGIRPRRASGLVGVFFAPFIHGGMVDHLVPNTVPFFVLGVLVFIGGAREFIIVTIVVALLAGLGTWIFGSRDSLHFGASSVIFGYLGFLLSRGFFDRKLKWIALSIVVGAAYAGTILVLFKVEAGVSWTGHFFGFASGVFAAWLLRISPEKEPTFTDLA